MHSLSEVVFLVILTGTGFLSILVYLIGCLALRRRNPRATLLPSTRHFPWVPGLFLATYLLGANIHTHAAGIPVPDEIQEPLFWLACSACILVAGCLPWLTNRAPRPTGVS